MTPIVIRYGFTLQDGRREWFDLELHPTKLQLMRPKVVHPPHWTRLDFHQCPHCPLEISAYPDCPLSLNLVSIVERLGLLISYDKVGVEVVMQTRRVLKDTTAQQGIGSLMGLVIATSQCPYTDFFKPMARFHLPFANEEETVWRATATYLTAQSFLMLGGQRADIDLSGLTQIYHNIETLNIAISKRLRAASQRDSAVNALIHLDIFAKHLTPGLEKSLKRLRHIFAPFLTRFMQF